MIEQFPLDRQLVSEVHNARQQGNDELARKIALDIEDETWRIQALVLMESTQDINA